MIFKAVKPTHKKFDFFVPGVSPGSANMYANNDYAMLFCSTLCQFNISLF